MQDLGYGENDENGRLTDEELNYVIPGDDEENQNNIEPQKSTEEILLTFLSITIIIFNRFISILY